jgi:hypothetical protein
MSSDQSTPPSRGWPSDHSGFAPDSCLDSQRWIAAIPGAAPDCRRPDAMGRNRRRRVCPRIDDIHYRTVRCCPDGLGCGCAPAAAATTRNSSSRGRIEAASRRGASHRLMECRVWAIGGAGGAHWAKQEKTGKALRGMCDAAAQCSQ